MNPLTLLLSMVFSNKSLYRKPTMEDFKKEINLWVTRNFGIIAIVSIIFLLIVFLWVCFALVGVSATDSGVQYNHFHEVIV